MNPRRCRRPVGRTADGDAVLMKPRALLGTRTRSVNGRGWAGADAAVVGADRRPAAITASVATATIRARTTTVVREMRASKICGCWAVNISSSCCRWEQGGRYGRARSLTTQPTTGRGCNLAHSAVDLLDEGSQRLQVEDLDLAPPCLDPPKLAEKVQRTRHRLPRGSGPCGQVLLRQGQCDPHAVGLVVAIGCGQLDQAAGDSCRDVASGEVDPLSVGLGKRRCDVVKDKRGDSGVLQNEATEVAGSHRERLDLIDSCDRRRAGPIRD